MAKRILALGNDGSLVLRNRDGSLEPLPKPANREPSVPHVAYLAIDCSGSMAASLSHAVSGSIGFFRDALGMGYYVGLITFGSDATMVCAPTRDEASMHAHLRTINAGGSTDMCGAIELAVHCLDIGRFPRAIVLVTDGSPDEPDSTLAAALRARELGIDVIALGTENADRAYLAKLTSRNDLAVTVSRKELAHTISSAVRLLPK